MSDMKQLLRAKAEVERQVLPDPGTADPTQTVHRVSIGQDDDGNDAIIVTAGPMMVAQGEDPRDIVPQKVRGVPVVVRIEEPPTVARLSLSEAMSQQLTTHRQCHDCPMPIGLQIAPRGARYVGTEGPTIKGPDGKPYGITNQHVGGDVIDAVMCQPDGNGRPYGKVKAVVGIQYGGRNFIDADLLDLTMPDGKASTGIEILDVGKMGRNWRWAKVGDRIGKSGRTTGVVRGGRVTEIEATSNVGYDGGTARFERQYVGVGPSGDLSGPGDSGSLVFFDDDLSPCGLLFAGGGGSTILSPIGFVLEWVWRVFGDDGDGWKTKALF